MDGPLVDAAPRVLDPDPVGPLRLGRLLVQSDPHLPEVAEQLVAALLEEPLRAVVPGADVGTEPDLLPLGRVLRLLPRPLLDPVAQLGADPAAAMVGKNTPERPQPVRMARTDAAARDQDSVFVLDQPPVAVEVGDAEERGDIRAGIAVVPFGAPERAHELGDGRQVVLGRAAEAMAHGSEPMYDRSFDETRGGLS